MVIGISKPCAISFASISITIRPDETIPVLISVSMVPSCFPESSRSYSASLLTAETSPSTFIQARSSLLRSEEHTSELQSRENLVCRLLLEKKNEPHHCITLFLH